MSIVLEIEHLSIEPALETLLWGGDIGRATFLARIGADVALGAKAARASILLNGLEIAAVNFVVDVTEDAVDDPRSVHTRVSRHRTAFASYASSDRDQVLGCIQGIQKAAPELQIFLDVISLRSGQDWKSELRRVIPNNDVFYLFWSVDARCSEWVDTEWRCALETRGLDFIDPVPLCTPEEAPPPPELADKHFSDWTVSLRRNRRRASV